MLRRMDLITLRAITLLVLLLALTSCSNVSGPSVSPSATPTADVQSSAAPSTIHTSADNSEGKSLEQIIPKQWQVIPNGESFIAKGDLNGDGIEDIAVVLEASGSEPEQTPKRALLLALGAGAERYLNVVINEAIVYRADEGGVFGDPLASLRIEDAIVHLEHYGGSNWRWSNSYRIDWREDGWYAVGYTSTSEFLNSPYYEEIKYEIGSGEVVLYKIDEEGSEGERTRQVEPGQYVKVADLTPESFDFLNTDSLTYESASLGFAITFPESWAGYYRVGEDERLLNVYFVGESEISRSSLFDEEPGLYMFSIGSNEVMEEYGELIDNAEEVGQSNGTVYYYFTATDCSVCLLTFSEDLNADNEAERMFRDSDFRRYQLMNEDIRQILYSFKG